MTMDLKQPATLHPPSHLFGGRMERGPVITVHKTDDGRNMDTSIPNSGHSHPVLGRTLAQPFSSPTSVVVSTVIKPDRRKNLSPLPSHTLSVNSIQFSNPSDNPSGYAYGVTQTISGSQLSSLGLNQRVDSPLFIGTTAVRGTVLSNSSPSPVKQKPLDDWLPSPNPISMDSPPPSNYPPSTTNLSSSNGGCSPTGSYEPYSPGGINGREDLSPGSVNGYTTPIEGFDPKKKKGPQPRQQDELCLVCGDRASGYHYNALTCEGCKGFFRRSITKNAVYQCKYGASCEIDMYMRRKCQECRLKKCLSVGMRPECVVPEQQCAVKREAKKQQKEKDKPNSTTTTTIDIRDADSIKEENSYALAALRKRLTAEQEELIHRLVFYQDEFENPSEEDVRRVTQLSLEADDSERGFRTVTEMTILTVQLTVEFSKRLPGFDTLLREDQITLLKACSSEVMMLRGARKYDAETDSIVFANNLPYTKDRYAMTGVEYTADELYGFARKMYCLKTDNAEYALITAIVIFSERAGLLEPKKVEKIQEIYMDTLYAYVFTHRPNPTVEFAKLINIPTTLRTLGTMNADLCMALKLKNKRLPQFLREIWDI